MDFDTLRFIATQHNKGTNGNHFNYLIRKDHIQNIKQAEPGLNDKKFRLTHSLSFIYQTCQPTSHSADLTDGIRVQEGDALFGKVAEILDILFRYSEVQGILPAWLFDRLGNVTNTLRGSNSLRLFISIS